MDLRQKIAEAVYDHPRADDQINAVMEVIEAEHGGQVTIPKKRLASLEKSEDTLLALEAAGVDNWGGYDDVMDALDGGK